MAAARTWPAACWPTWPPRRPPRSSRSRMPSRARSSTKPATARWPRSKEMPFGRYYGSVDATPLFVCWPAPTTSAPATGRSSNRSGRTSRRPCSWIDRYGDLRRRRLRRVPAADRRRPGAPGLEGLGRRHLPRRRLAGPRPHRAVRSPGLRLRRPAGRRAVLAAALGRAERAAELAAAGRGIARAVRAGVLVRGPVHLCPGPGRRQAALPGADVQRRPLPVHGHRRPERARAAVAETLLAPNRSPAGACGPWRPPSAATTPCPITTAPSGRTTTP